jgi:hypothetical protein
MKFIFENKKYLFLKIDNIFDMCSLAHFFSLLFYSSNLMCVSISIIIWLNKKIILISKFSKHNWVNFL